MPDKPNLGRSRRLLGAVPALLLLLLFAPAAAFAAPAPGFAVSSVWEIDQPLRAGDYIWDDSRAPAGPLRIVVDLEAELLYVYRGGMEIGRSSILYGYDDKPTPTGVFPILDKDRDHVSNIYDAPMPYMLRLTNGGIAIHGSLVEDGYATHGCVGVPEPFAAALFASAHVGDPVLITKGWTRQVYAGAEAISPARPAAARRLAQDSP